MAIVGPARVGGILSQLGRLIQTRTASLAWFYTPPTDTTTSSTIAKTNDFITLAQPNGLWRELGPAYLVYGYSGRDVTNVVVGGETVVQR